MPTEQELAHEITLARTDLETNLSELEHAVKAELDLDKQAHALVDFAKKKARELVDRKVLEAKLFVAAKRDEYAPVVARYERDAKALYARARQRIHDEPLAAAAIAATAVAAVIGGVVLYRRLAND